MPRMPSTKYDMRKVERDAKQRRGKILRLRDQGLTLRQIADKLGISYQRVGILAKRAESERPQ